VQHSTSRTAPTGATRSFPAFGRSGDVVPCSFERFVDALSTDVVDERPRATGTIRPHFGVREFGQFSTVLAEARASLGMEARVHRWRERDAEQREDVPLRSHPDQSADDRRLLFAVTITAATLFAWILIGVAAAWLRGAL
jgi:hypothetical protein